jgi:hypothetical protein
MEPLIINDIFWALTFRPTQKSGQKTTMSAFGSEVNTNRCIHKNLHPQMFELACCRFFLLRRTRVWPWLTSWPTLSCSALGAICVELKIVVLP